MKKETVRTNIRTRKALLSEQEKIDAARAVFALLEQTPAFMMADRILVYHSLPDELSTLEFLDKWHTRKHFFLPRVNGVNLDILPYDRTRLHLGAFQIEEPDGDEITPVDSIEMIIVPGVAYDHNGRRVGRGKGFYDRLLATSHAVKIGVSYDFQLIDEIETEEHDIPVDIVITDRKVCYPRRR